MTERGILKKCHDARAQMTFCIRYYLVKMYAARVQSTRSLLASPPCSAVSVTTFMLSLHSIDHYITICHPVVTFDNHPDMLFITSAIFTDEDPLLWSTFGGFP